MRLRSQAYGYLALVALPVAWVGGVVAVGPGVWHGPAAALLVAAYSLIGVPAQRLPGLGPRFMRVVFVHGAAVLAALVTLTSAALVRAAGATHAGLAAIWSGRLGAVAIHQLGLGAWQGPAGARLSERPVEHEASVT